MSEVMGLSGIDPTSVAEVCIDVRCPDGSLLRRANQEQAQQLIAKGLGVAVKSRSGVLQRVRLFDDPRPSNSRRTWAATGDKGGALRNVRHLSRNCEAYGRGRQD